MSRGIRRLLISADLVEVMLRDGNTINSCRVTHGGLPVDAQVEGAEYRNRVITIIVSSAEWLEGSDGVLSPTLERTYEHLESSSV
jgi:hypothetical protein